MFLLIWLQVLCEDKGIVLKDVLEGDLDSYTPYSKMLEILYSEPFERLLEAISDYDIKF